MLLDFFVDAIALGGESSGHCDHLILSSCNKEHYESHLSNVQQTVIDIV